MRFVYDLERSHHNAQLRASDVGTEVVLMGWVQTRRDHGGVIFVDLRDLEGLTQVVFDPQISQQAHQQADDLRTEYCIGIKGKVRPRPEGMINSKLPTGKVEVAVESLEVFNKSPTPPFEIEDDLETNESVRLKYRYLDLRRRIAKQPILVRSKLTHLIRRFFDERNYYEIETPFLTKSTPEGARDYLVPARNYPGHAFALPQSPQIFKQLLMVAGFERYYQIVRCFRDEDLRADRQPDFTQLDIEMSFVNQEQVFSMTQELWAYVWKEILGYNLDSEFPRMTYSEAMEKYGVDKPDLRLDWTLTTVTDVFKTSDFKVFRDVSEKGNLIQCLKVPDASDKLSRKDLDDLTPLGKTFGAKGIAWIKVNKVEDYKEGWQSPISKFLSDSEKEGLTKACDLKSGDLLVFCADVQKIVSASLGEIRLELGRKLNAIKTDEWKFLWVVDFPLFQYDSEAKRWVSEHHPFTSPKPENLDNFDTEPEKALSNSYDLVLNGNEMGSGSIRIHNPEVQSRVFRLLDLSEDEIQQKFGFLIDALRYGSPPHGGIAFGLDRFAMLLSRTKSLREVIAFPKTQRAQCLLTEAPSPISKQQWKELNLKALD